MLEFTLETLTFSSASVYLEILKSFVCIKHYLLLSELSLKFTRALNVQTYLKFSTEMEFRYK